MANNTRSIHKITEEDTRGRRSSARLAGVSVSTGKDSSGLRRSSREISSNKKVTPENRKTRMSKRLEKQTPSAPSTARKLVEKRPVPSPLRRSERCKKQRPSLSSSGSKISGKESETSVSHTEKMEEGKKEISMKRLTQRAKEARRVESDDTKSTETKKGRMDAHAYRALFRKQEKKDKLSGNVHHSSSNIDVDGQSRITVLAIGNCNACPINCELSSPRKFPADVCTNSESHSSKELDASENCQGNFSLISEKISFPEQLHNPGNESNLESSTNHNFQSLPSPRERVPDASNCMGLEGGSGEVFPGRVDSITNGRSSGGDGCMDMVPEVVDDASAMANCEDKTPAPSPSSSAENFCVEDGGLNMKRKSGELEAGLNSRFGENITKNEQQLDQPLEIQANCEDTYCSICKLGGLLLRCCHGKDCKRSFHLSCLYPPLKDVSLGDWYCPACVRKRMEFGVHSISQGVEAIYDVREMEAPDDNGVQVQKQFFVKYKGLAHIHNRWVPEAELLLESPSVISSFDKRKQTMKWQPEWAMPHRLLEKRLIWHDEVYPADMAKANCRYQWLVKWCGLGYEHATWELEEEPFFNSSEAANLIKEFETRHDRARSCLNLERSKLQERKKASRSKLSKLPNGISAGSDSNCLDVVNRLLEFWQRSHNAIIIDDQEYMLKVISFIASLQSDACHPFLIISNSNSLNSWEVEFFRLARTINLVVYDGDKELRKSIRSLEFFEEGGASMFQVLLSAPLAVAEDMDVLKCIEWEAIIVDECQSSSITKHFEEFKMLNAEMRLLLYKGHLQESFSEYSDLLSLLDHQSGCRTGNGFGTSSNDSILKLQERLSCFIVSGCKVESSRFLEYWVPVQLSNIQLEQYCATLLSNSLSLRSSSKTDPVGALRDILFASRKCCDHPYLVDPSLQKLLIKDLPVVQYLDVGIKASGKLQFLDKLLSELQNRRLRALILFQSIGSLGRDAISIGDILDDFLRQRFGADSYERIDGDVPRHKKIAATNNYNNKDLGRFVFLLEARACLPSVKLVSVDVVIIFGSDWNPVNDIRSLQKVQLESQFEQIKLFRLYTSCAVEEKVLINAKNGESIAMQNAHPSTSHSLLMWGARHLFDELKEFHHSYRPSAGTASCDQSHSKNVLDELLAILPGNDESITRTKSSPCSLISRAQPGSQTFYGKEIPLLGESKIQSDDEELPHLFWTKLLEGKAPDWKYSSVSQQRNRKRVQVNENQYTEIDGRNEVGKKRRKAAENNIDLSSKKQRKEEPKLAAANMQASDPVRLSSLERGAAVASVVNTDGSDGRRTIYDAQRRLHLILKPQISRLCEALSLEGEVKDMVYTFLDYVINNRVVIQEPATILQAFQLALCWTAASLVKLKIDRKESLALARDYLHYGCSKDEAEGVYTILRGLKKPFLRHNENSKSVHTSKAPEKVNEIPTENLNSNLSQSPVFFPNKMKVEIEDWPLHHESHDKDVLASPTLAERDIPFSIQEIQGNCSEQMAELLREQEEERNEIYRSFEVEKGVLENEQRLEEFFITQLHRDGPVRAEKLKALENEYSRKIKDCENQMNIRLKELEEAQLAARNELQQKEASSVGAWHQDQIDSVDSISDGGNQVENLQTNDGEALPSEAVAVNEEAPVLITSAETDTSHENSATCTILERSAGAGSFKQDLGDAVPVNPLPEGNIPDGATPAVPGCESSHGQIAEETAPVLNREVASGIHENIEDVPGRVISVISQSENVPVIPQSENVPVIPQSQDVVPCKETSMLPNGDVASDAPADVSSSGIQAPENPVSDYNRSSDDKTQRADETTTIMPDEEPAPCGPENGKIQKSMDVQPPLSREQVLDGPTPGAVIPEADTAPEDGPNQVDSACEHLEDPLDGPTSEVLEVVPGGVDTVPEDGANEVESAIPDGINTGPEHGSKEAENASEPPADGISVGYQDISGQLVATPDHGAAVPLNQISPNQGHTTSMSPDSGTAQPSDQPCPEPIGSEVAMQIPAPPMNPETAAGVPHQCRREDGLNTQNASNQFVAEPSIPSALQMAAPPLGPLDTGVTAWPSLPSAAQLALPKCSDPLQNELERLRLESDLTTKIYEDTKSKLKADCEKEIEVVVAQIRMKYETKIRETEAEYLLKSNELQANQNKVLMNKILAEAFRSKCVDLRASAGQAVQQDAVASNTQQNPQASPFLVPRHTSSALLRNNNRTAISHPINSRSLQPMRPSASVQLMSPSAPVHSSRSPIICQFPPPGNLLAQHEVRAPAPAPAPRLHPFRPSPPVLPSRAPPPLPPGYRPRPFTSLPPTAVTNLPPQSAQSTGVHQPGFSPLGSALELLVGVSRQPVSNQQPNSFQLPMRSTVAGSNLDAQNPSTGNNSEAEVFCLSDDD